MIIPLRLSTPAGVLSFLSTTTVFGTPVDVTLSELALESFYPADAATGEALRRLADAVGPWPAMIVVSLGFAAAHLGNPAVGAIGLLNIALAGAWLSFAFFSPAGMPLAWGLHFGLNAGLGLVFDAPVSGFRLRVPAVEYAPGRLAWVDGGLFGPEGGLVATIVLIAGTLAVLGGRFKQPKEWLV